MLRLVLILFLLGLNPTNSYASQDLKETQQVDSQDFDRNNMIIVRVDLRKSLTLSEALVGYQHNGNIFLSFSEFTDILDFPIHLENNSNIAKGWFISEDMEFSFDLENLDSVSNKKEHKINPNYFKIFDDELFVDIRLLQDWFPIQIEFDSFNQLINIESFDPLPVENKAERERKWNELYQKKSLEKQEQDIEIRKAPYRLATLPLADVRYRYDYDKNESSQEDYASQLSVLASGDLLYLNHNLFADFEKGDGVSQIRLKSGKQDVDPVLLGPLKAREFELGDIYNQQIPLVARGEIGKGLMVSNYAQNYVSEFDSIVVRGDIQNDWQVELYRNDSLIDFKEATADGIYEFLDVPLVSGLNIIKLVFYGPHGERREEERRYLMDPTLVKKNRFYYRISANEHNADLIRVNKKEDNFGDADVDGKSRYVGEFEYGLSSNFSLLANLSHIPIEVDNGEHRDYSNLGLKSSLFGINSRVDFINDLTNDIYAAQTSLQAKIKSYDFSLKHAHFEKNFTSEFVNAASNSLKDESSFRINGPLEVPGIKTMRLSLRTNREYYSSKNERLENEFSLNLPASDKLNITQDINYNIDERVVGDGKNITTGRTFFNYRIWSDLIARSLVSYNISPTEELTNSSININYYLRNELTINLNAVHQFANSTQSNSTNYLVSVSKTFDKYRASIGSNYNDEGSYGINFAISSSFGYDPKYDSGVVSNKPMADNGSVATKVFVDEDNNNRYDEGERLLPDMDFKVDGRKVENSTNENGVLLIENLTSNRQVSIELDPSNLEDPYLYPVAQKVKVISHAGSMDYLDFAIVNTGEIEGVVNLFNGRKLIGSSNVLLELINESGKVIKTTLSSFDGFYLFDKVPIGKYQIRISSEQLKRLKLADVESRYVELTKDDYLVTGADFKVIPKEK